MNIQLIIDNMVIALKSLKKKEKLNKEQLKERCFKLIDDSDAHERYKKILSDKAPDVKKYSYEKDENYSIEEKQILDCSIVICMILTFANNMVCKDLKGFIKDFIEKEQILKNV